MLIDKNMPPSFSIMIVHCGDDLGAVGNTNSTLKRTSQLKGIFFTFANYVIHDHFRDVINFFAST
jgi:hypothetical protein